MMTKVFEPVLGKTVEAYIDDIFVNSKAREDHLDHLIEAFRLVREHRSRLNPIKWAFGVNLGNFMGILVSNRGIEMAPGQVQVIIQMRMQTIKKEI